MSARVFQSTCQAPSLFHISSKTNITHSAIFSLGQRPLSIKSNETFLANIKKPDLFGHLFFIDEIRNSRMVMLCNCLAVVVIAIDIAMIDAIKVYK